MIEQPEILTTIQMSAKKAGKADISNEEIEAEITAYRKEKRKKVS